VISHTFDIGPPFRDHSMRQGRIDLHKMKMGVTIRHERSALLRILLRSKQPCLRERFMADKLTLVVRFRIPEPVKEEFLARLREVFTHIVKEETFVEASLVQDMREPEIILNYEVWNESPESFMKNQMSKPYRAEFEKMIADAKIERTPAWYSTIDEWQKTSRS